MIYLLETRERCVYAFASKAEGIAHASGEQVTAGLWQFFDVEGMPLVASFTALDQRGLRSAPSSTYRLVPAPRGAARLQEVLHELRAVVIDGKRLAVAALRERLPPVVPG